MFLFTFFFSLPLSSVLMAASISHFLTATSKFSCFSSNKKCLLCFLSLSSSLSLFSLLSFAGLSPTFSFSLSFSFSIVKFVDMAIILNLILWTTWIQKQSPLSIFVFIDSLVLRPGLIWGVYGSVWRKTLPFNETTTSFTSHQFRVYIFLQQNGFFASSFIFLCPI